MPILDSKNEMRGRLRKTLRNVIFQAAAQGGNSAGRYVAFLLLARIIAVSELDRCAIYLTAALVIGNLCDLGLNVACLKFSAMAETTADRLWTQKRFLGYRLILTLVVSGTAYTGAAFFATTLLGHAEYAEALKWASVVGTLSSIVSFTNAALQATGQFPAVARASAVATALQFVGFAAALFLRAPGLIALVAAELIGRLVFLLCNSALLRKIAIADRPQAPIESTAKILRFTIWVSLSTGLGAFYNSIPILALTRFADSTAVSTYAVGAALAGWVSLITNTGMTVLLSEAMAATVPEARAIYLKTYLPVALLAAVVLIPSLWFAAPGILAVAGPRHASAAGVFRLLASSYLVLLIANPVQFLLYPMNRPAICTLSDAVILILFGTLAFALTPGLGVEGPAMALLIGQTSVKAVVAVGIVFSTIRTLRGRSAPMQAHEVSL